MYICLIKENCSSIHTKNITVNLGLLVDYFLVLKSHNGNYCYIVSDQLFGKEVNEQFTPLPKDTNKNIAMIKTMNQDLFTNINIPIFLVGFNKFYFEPQSIRFIASNVWNKKEDFIYNSLFYLNRLLLLRYSFIHELTSIYLSSSSYTIENNRINVLKYHFNRCDVGKIIDHFISSEGSNALVDFNENTNSGIMLFDFSTGVSSFSLLFDEILRGLEGCVGGSG